jgi:hypothetical protein
MFRLWTVVAFAAAILAGLLTFGFFFRLRHGNRLRSSRSSAADTTEEGENSPNTQPPDAPSSDPIRKESVKKHARPKISLIDLQPEVARTLSEAGFAVDEGTFGRPYNVISQETGLFPVLQNWVLPGLAEKDVLVVDLEAGEPIPAQPVPERPNEPGWWTKPSSGIIDPRPLAMGIRGKYTNRILEHNGLVVVFAGLERSYEYVLAHLEHGGLILDGKTSVFSNWSLSSLLHYRFGTTLDIGEEVLVDRGDTPVHSLLRTFNEDLHFSCTVAPIYDNEPGWLPLATNEYGAPVSGAIIQNGKIKISIFSRVRHQASFVSWTV